MKILFPVLLIAVVVPLGAVTGAENDLQKLAWLLGEWQSERDNSVITEKWVQVSPVTFEGAGQTKDKSTQKIVDGEALRIVAMAGEIFYLAKVAHNPLPIAFRLVNGDNSSALFENTTHDFPKKILYKLVDQNHLVVTVSGDDRKFEISFTRQNGG